MKKALGIVAVIVAFTATCFAAELPTFNRVDGPMPLMTKPVARGLTIAVPPNTTVVEATHRTIAVLEISGDPTTGEVSVRQVPMLEGEGLSPKANVSYLFSQIGLGTCTNCTPNPDPAGTCSRSIQFDLDVLQSSYICDADLTLVTGGSINVDGISNPTWEGGPLPDDIYVDEADDTYFGFDVDVTDCSQRFQVYVNVEGTASPTGCTGPLEFELTWGPPQWSNGADSDLDIMVFGPNPPCTTQVNFDYPSACGGVLDTQCNFAADASDCANPEREICPAPLEHIQWDVPPEGLYMPYAWSFQACSASYPISFRMRVLVNGVEVRNVTGTIPLFQSWTVVPGAAICYPSLTLPPCD